MTVRVWGYEYSIDLITLSVVPVLSVYLTFWPTVRLFINLDVIALCLVFTSLKSLIYLPMNVVTSYPLTICGTLIFLWYNPSVLIEVVSCLNLVVAPATDVALDLLYVYVYSYVITYVCALASVWFQNWTVLSSFNL